MGFFSYKTADTKLSVPADEAFHPRSGKNIYLLQPKAEPNILSQGYGGFGVFGDINVFSWLSMWNTGVDDFQIGNLISCESSGRLYDEKVYVCAMHFHKSSQAIINKVRAREGKKPIEFVSVDNYASEFTLLVEEGGKRQAKIMVSLNIMCELGLGKDLPICNMIEIKYPLKLSYQADAVYEGLEGSEHCPNQGYFY